MLFSICPVFTSKWGKLVKYFAHYLKLDLNFVPFSRGEELENNRNTPILNRVNEIFASITWKIPRK